MQRAAAYGLFAHAAVPGKLSTWAATTTCHLQVVQEQELIDFRDPFSIYEAISDDHLAFASRRGRPGLGYLVHRPRADQVAHDIEGWRGALCRTTLSTMDLFKPPLQDDSAIEELAAAGRDLAASVSANLIGLGVGATFGGPVGGVIGAATGPILSHTFTRVGRELKARWLSPREEQRIGAVLLLASQEIAARRAAGQQERQDGFFQAGYDDRTTADEIIEGIAQAAQREYQERKLPFLSSLLASFAFGAAADSAHMVALIQFASTLTYRQLVLIRLFSVLDEEELVKPRLSSETHASDETLAALITELSDLSAKGLVVGTGTFDGGQAFFGTPQSGRLSRTGQELCSRLELERIQRAEIDGILHIVERGDSHPSRT